MILMMFVCEDNQSLPQHLWLLCLYLLKGEPAQPPCFPRQLLS